MKTIEYLRDNGIKFKILHLKEVPKTAQDVERIYGCSLHQVLKTIVFVGEKAPVIVVLPGDKKVNINKLKEITKQDPIKVAKPEEVVGITGFSIGGVSPFVQNLDIKKIIDASVFKIKVVNIGSGKADVGIELSSIDLKKIWDGEIADIIE